MRRLFFLLVLVNVLNAGEGTIEFVQLDATPAPAMGYAYYLPPGFSASTATYPVLVHLGGTGERGNGTTDLPQVLRNGPLAMLQNTGGHQPFKDLMAIFPAIVVQPQLVTNGNWSGATLNHLRTVITANLNAKFPGRVDYQRVWITGFSLGGGGAWLYAQIFGNEVAGLMPVAGASSASSQYERFTGLPIWAFHCANDGIVTPDFTRFWIKNLVTPWQGAAPTDPAANLIGGWGAGPTPSTIQSGRYNLGAGWTWQSGIVSPTTDYPTMTMFITGGHDWAPAMKTNLDGWKWLFTQSLSNRPLSAGLVVDNFDPRHTSQTGTWQLEAPSLSLPTSEQAFLNNGHLATGGSGATFTFSPVITATGSYRLNLRWTTPATNPTGLRNNVVPVTITSDGAPTTVLVNQQLNGNTWVDLGQFSFTAGGTATIVLSTTGLPTGVKVSADAIRLVPVDVLMVTGSSPANGGSAGGTAVTITGSGFDSGAAVTFGGAAATAVTVVTASSITCTTPAHSAGRNDVVVTSGGASALRSGAFTFTGGSAGTNPVITSALTAQPVRAQPFSYTITATGSTPITFAVSGLPGGLTVNATTGLVGGTATASGNFGVTLTATNAFGSNTRTLDVTVLEPPTITSALTATASVGVPFSYSIIANGAPPITLGTSGLPAGLSCSGAVISGTPTAAGTSGITLTASHPSAGTDTRTLTLTVGPSPDASRVLINGGFESPAVGSGFQYAPASAGWTFSSDAGVSGNGSGFTSGNPSAPDGAQVGFLQRAGSVRQTMTLTAGTYQVTFQAAKRGNSGGSNDLCVLIDGVPRGTVTPSQTSYAAFSSQPFSVSAGAHELTVQGLNSAGGDNTVLIDAVALITGQIIDPAIGLVARWKLDETNGTTVLDSSGNGNHGTAQKGPVWAAGAVGGALDLDGVDDTVVIPASTTLNQVGANGTDLSTTFWIQLNRGGTGLWRSVIHKGASYTQRTMTLQLLPNSNHLHYRISTTTDFNEGGNSSVAELPVNAWAHVAYVKSGNQLILYINGVRDSAVTLRGTVIGNSGPMYLGNDPCYSGSAARLDDVRVYSRALSEQEVVDLAAPGGPG